MLKMAYFNVHLLLGMLRSKQVSVYSVNVRGSFKLSTGGGSSYPRAVMPQVTLSLFAVSLRVRCPPGL